MHVISAFDVAAACFLPHFAPKERRCPMLLMIGVVVLVLWLLGVVALPAAGALVHLLLVVALIVIVAHFLGLGRGRQTV